MKKPLVIFGTGKISEAVSYFFSRDSEYQIIGYVVDDGYFSQEYFLNKPVIKLSKLRSTHPIENTFAFVAIGYHGINELRSQKFNLFKEWGYQLASYKSPAVKTDYDIGVNSIVMDGAVFQPCVKVKNNVFVWGGAMIGHHAILENHTWLTGGCLIGGSANIGEKSFIGIGASIGHEVNVGEKCMVGAKTLVTNSIDDGTVLIEPPTKPHRLNSNQFVRMSTCFQN